MLLPSADQYSSLIEKKDPHSFTFLNDYTFLSNEVNGKKEYIFYKGLSAVIFKAVKDNKHFAVRCFLRADRETFRRYEEKARFLSPKDLPWKVPFEFFDNEIFFEGQQYGVQVMEWLEGGTNLYHYLDTIIYDPLQISKLQDKLISLSKNLEENGIGHGDLNFHHIVIKTEGSEIAIRLLDYDSVFIPQFRDLDSQDSGTPGFQHPRRLATDFSDTIDRFSIWILITGLEAVKNDPSLWRDSGYRNNRYFLFTLRDLINPDQSKLFQRLHNYKTEALDYYLEELVRFCQLTNLNEIAKPQLFQKSYMSPAGKDIPPLTPDKKLEIEVKSQPAGRDVLVGGQKKGITPLRLSLSKNEY